MIWVIRLYLLIMAFIYALIGVWALLDPLLGALDQGYPSFLDAVRFIYNISIRLLRNCWYIWRLEFVYWYFMFDWNL